MKTLIALATLAAAGLVTPAFAAIPAEAPTQTVRHADLDLSKPADVRILDLRIHRAAIWACGDVSSFDLAGRKQAEACRAEIVARLAPARLTAIQHRTGVQLAANR